MRSRPATALLKRDALLLALRGALEVLGLLIVDPRLRRLDVLEQRVELDCARGKGEESLLLINLLASIVVPQLHVARRLSLAKALTGRWAQSGALHVARHATERCLAPNRLRLRAVALVARNEPTHAGAVLVLVTGLVLILGFPVRFGRRQERRHTVNGRQDAARYEGSSEQSESFDEIQTLNSSANLPRMHFGAKSR